MFFFFCQKTDIIRLTSTIRQKGSGFYAAYLFAFLSSFTDLLSLTACGGTAQPNPPAQTGDDASQTETPDTAPEPAEEPEEPQQKPYVISSPTVDRGTVDGVTYVPWDGVVEHLFFHPIVAYPELAFDGDSQANGIDDWMVTVDEYDKILQSVYDRGYVLVDINDVWSESTDASGQPVMVRNTLYIPEGKKPLIISYDDVNYYDYMLEDGFTYKLIIGDDGLIWSYGLDPQGNEVISQDLDAITILDKFVREHPDFSPFGAKGSLSLTGYQGILGYRTNTDTKVWNDELEANRQKECEAVKPIIAELKRTGWTFGSHTWGHINLSSSSLERVQADTKRWLDEVGSLVGPTTILYYPHGARPDGDDVQQHRPHLQVLAGAGLPGVCLRGHQLLFQNQNRHLRRHLRPAPSRTAPPFGAATRSSAGTASSTMPGTSSIWTCARTGA